MAPFFFVLTLMAGGSWLVAEATSLPATSYRLPAISYNRKRSSTTRMTPDPADRAAHSSTLLRGDPRKKFFQIFGGPSRLYRAPGRVNLIGEHTDYNQGFVMPAAIGLYCSVAIAPRGDRELHIYSTHFKEKITVDLDSPAQVRRADWSDYVVGTAVAIENSGCVLGGANVVVSGEIPLGSGLSSSAAIEVSTGYALLDVSGHAIDCKNLALACQRAENEFVGARCGIMDQFVSAHGRAGHALMLDCRTLNATALPLPDSMRLLVCNTGVKHQHAAGEYNARRAQCEEGVRLLSSAIPGIASLRDLSSTQLEQHKRMLPELIYRRCRHVVTENERVRDMAEALARGDLRAVASLMADSHCSLRNDYEVSCPELDIMVELAAEMPGVIGARMTGGGFGGCTVNLVDAEAAESVQRSVAVEYEARTHIRPDTYLLTATDGVAEVVADQPTA